MCYCSAVVDFGCCTQSSRQHAHFKIAGSWAKLRCTEEPLNVTKETPAGDGRREQREHQHSVCTLALAEKYIETELDKKINRCGKTCVNNHRSFV